MTQAGNIPAMSDLPGCSSLKALILQEIEFRHMNDYPILLQGRHAMDEALTAAQRLASSYQASAGMKPARIVQLMGGRKPWVPAHRWKKDKGGKPSL